MFASLSRQRKSITGAGESSTRCDLIHILDAEVNDSFELMEQDQLKQRGWIMPAIFDLLYREYCRARLAEMRKQLLISPERHEVPEAICDAKDAVDASPVSHVVGTVTAPFS
jgi:hypothetical protein